MGWSKLTRRLGKKNQLVGDDLFATNAFILQDGKYLKKNISASLFSWGEFFLYKENDKYKLIVPKEIKEIVNDAKEESSHFDV